MIAYRTSGREFSAFVGSEDTLASSRRIRLINRVNEVDQAAFAALRASVRDLREERQALEVAQAAQGEALDALRNEGAAMDAKLAVAAWEEQSLVAEPRGSSSPTPSSPSTSSTPRSSVGSTAAAPTSPSVPPSTPPAPPSYIGRPGVHPQHNDVFLSCLRARESGGNYAAVDPTGLYRGAYQFHQTTWNGAANHAGRRELIGVPPNVASTYDQDDLAWALYQWQGAGPWGGGCS